MPISVNVFLFAQSFRKLATLTTIRFENRPQVLACSSHLLYHYLYFIRAIEYLSERRKKKKNSSPQIVS